ncbi:MAG TPA: hypothetical protein VGE13_02265 [Candidatus Saccharimonadales bacterium]
MNNERPVLSPDNSGWEQLQGAIGEKPVILDENRGYMQDGQATLYLPTDEQLAATLRIPEYEQSLLTKEQYTEFDNNTNEGRKIREVWHYLQILEAGLRQKREYTVPVPLKGQARPEGLGELGELSRLSEWAEANKLGLDFDLLEADDVSTDELDQVLATVNNTQETILYLREKLIRHPEIRFLSEVTVLRSGRNGEPDYPEMGWQVFSIRGDGRLVLMSAERKLRKFATIDELISWQGIAE